MTTTLFRQLRFRTCPPDGGNVSVYLSRNLQLASLFVPIILIMTFVPVNVAAQSWWERTAGKIVGQAMDGFDRSPPVQPGQPAGPAASPYDNAAGVTRAQLVEIERLLVALGYQPGPVDGSYGAATAAAIRAYQDNQGLPQTGFPSAELLMHLRATQQTRLAAGPPVSASQVYDRTQVYEIQLYLTELGYQPGPLDGYSGAATAAAITRYQQDHGLPQTGVPSKGLHAHLQNARRAGPVPEAEQPAAGIGAFTETDAAPAPETVQFGAGAGIPNEADTAAAANPLQVGRGPGGREMIEVPMPPGFKPILLVGLDGMPVAGFPVSERFGELNPRNWGQTATPPPDIDVGFSRLLEALYLRQEPKLLQGLTYTESFARNHLDDQSRSVFFPVRAKITGLPDSQSPSSSIPAGFIAPPSPIGSQTRFGTNEFERKQLFAQFLTQYEKALRQSLPQPPFEFIYIEQVLLQTYDEAGRAFPISTRYGESGRIRLRNLAGAGSGTLMVTVPASLPIDPQAAQQLLERIPDRNPSGSGMMPIRQAYLGLRLALTGFETDSYGRVTAHVEPQGIGLYEDQLLKRRIHDFPLQPTRKQPAAESIAAIPLTPHLANLYAMRDIDAFLSDEAVFASAKYLIVREQGRWRQISASLSPRQCHDKLTTFEWEIVRPELAHGPLLDVLMQPLADWSFLDQETRFGMVPDHCVEVFIFSRQSVEGRQPDFAARDLAPVYKATLEAAISRLPERVFISRTLPAPQYDHRENVLFFEETPPDSASSRDKPVHLLPWTFGSIEYLEPGEASKLRSTMAIRAPKTAEGLAIYDLAIHDPTTPLRPPPQPETVTEQQHGEGWRTSVQIFRGDRRDEPGALALDRQLEYPRIKMKPAAAERLLSEYNRPGDQSLRAIIVIEIERAQSLAPGWRGILFGRLDRVVVTSHDGGEIATLEAASFADAEGAHSQGVTAQQNEQDTFNREQREKEEAERARAATVQTDIEAAFVRCDTDAPTATARLECYEAICQSGHSGLECAQKIRSARIEVNREAALAAGNRFTKKSRCSQLAGSTWRLSKGTREYDDFVEACLAQAERIPYGPDILGLQLGMDRSESDKRRLRSLAIAEQDKNKLRRRADEPSPFADGTLYFSAARDHFLAVYTADNFGKQLVAVISRRVYFNERPQPLESLLASMVDKYGEPLWQDQRHLLWSFSDDGRPRSDASAGKCSGLAQLLTEPKWKTYSSRDEEVSRLAPPFLSSEAGRAGFAAFGSCSVVLVARIGSLSSGAVGDLSLTLFDPRWIAEQPDLSFETREEKSTKLDF